VERLGARRNWLIWGAVVPVALWAIVRTFGLERGFPGVALMAFTPYAAAGALLVLGLATALRNWAASLTAALATVALVAAVAPRAFGGPDPFPPGGRELRVLSANVRKGHADPRVLVGLARRLHADVLTVEELTPRYVQELDAAGLDAVMPHTVLRARREAGGGGIFSRLPIRALPSPPTKALHMARGAIDLGGGRVVRLAEVHPYPPDSVHDMGLYREGMDSLPTAGGPGPPWVLGGDFNSTLDFARLRQLLDTGYRDSGDVLGKGLIGTWPQGRVLPPPVTIDHILAEDGIAILGYEVEDLPGSDHRAVFARLAVPPSP
jgi:endonuclease/exonuclease/phosphatase (EEP) superfamily protein YafD